MAFLLNAKGLYTFRNELNVPDGALEKADNIVIDENDVITPRRGFQYFGTNFGITSTRLQQLLTYKDRLFRHYGTTLEYDSDAAGTFLPFSGAYSELDTGLRIKGKEGNSNFYFTSTEGIKKISATSSSDFSTSAGYIRNAGAFKALDSSAALTYELGGILPGESKVAYRVLWAYTDNNKNLILGYPSARLVVTNSLSNTEIYETSEITITDYTQINAQDYIMFSTTTENYFIWFDVSGTDTIPRTSETLGKTGIKVPINGLSSHASVAVAIGNEIAQNTAFTVSVNSATVSVVNVVAGTVLNVITEQTGGVSGVTVARTLIGQIINASTSTPVISITVPENITSDYVYQIYRTGITTVSSGLTIDDIDPGDEMNLIYESSLTPAEIADQTVVFTDDITDDFRISGTLLYTNPISGDGILQANERPPIAKDIESFRESMFYSNTKTSHKKQITLLSTSGFTSGSSQIIIGNSLITREYAFIGATQIQRIDVVADIANSLNNTYFNINSALNERKYYVWFNTGTGTDPLITGKIGVEVSIATGDANSAVASALEIALEGTGDFTCSVSTEKVTITWNKNGNVDATVDGAVPTAFTINAPSTAGDGESRYGTISNISAANPAVVTIANHGLKSGDIVYIKDSNSGISIDGERVATVIGANTFSVPVDNTVGSGGSTGNAGTLWQTDVLLSNLGSVAQSIDESARSLVKVINKDYDSPVYAYYLSGANDLPGLILLENRELTDVGFFIATNDSTISTKFNPELSATESITSISIANPTVITSANHGLVNGNKIYIYNTNSTPVLFGEYTVTRINSNTFSVPVNVTNAGSAGIWFLTDVASDNEEKPNRLYYSKIGQPEAVPIINYVDIGARDQEIKRIIALRDNLFVLKTDGVFIITGPSAPDFSSRLLDNSAIILAPDSASVLNNQIFVLTDQGVVRITESGVDVISRPIENEINNVANSRFNYKTISYGIGYENDRAYILWLPTKTIDTVATQAYRYNIFTSTWTKWTKSATCAVVGTNNKLYIGDGDLNYTLEERKNLDRTDYADPDISLSISTGAVNNKYLTVSSASNVDAGDTMVQTQYVTISEFNRLLLKLDLDSGLDDNDYYSTLVMVDGDDIQTELNALNVKLVADDSSGIITPVSFSATWSVLQTQFNTMIGQLNSSLTDTVFKDYKTSSGTIPYEAIVVAVDYAANILTLNQYVPWLKGNIYRHKCIETDIIWKPQHFGDPAMLKQIREGTILFDQNNFYSASISFASDLNQAFEETEFFSNSVGYWGMPNWGNFIFGGKGNDVPIRVYVPAEKQRCRYLTCRFKHCNAREGFRILGISLEPRQLSKRGYR